MSVLMVRKKNTVEINQSSKQASPISSCGCSNVLHLSVLALACRSRSALPNRMLSDALQFSKMEAQLNPPKSLPSDPWESSCIWAFSAATCLLSGTCVKSVQRGTRKCSSKPERTSRVSMSIYIIHCLPRNGSFEDSTLCCLNLPTIKWSAYRRMVCI